MDKKQQFEEILKREGMYPADDLTDGEEILKAILLSMQSAYNLAINDAAEAAKVYEPIIDYFEVDKESILKLLINLKTESNYQLNKVYESELWKDIEVNFQGLNDLIINEDIRDFYKRVIWEMVTRYTNQDKWISIEDSLPEYELEVQICNNLDAWISQGYYSKYELRGLHEDWFNSFDNQCPCYPTHWQPLPEKPSK